jgi:nucleoside-diphosphate-sugar epimerase
MRLLLTGGAGRLGVELVKLASARGYSCRAFDLPNVSFDAIKETPNVEMFGGDVTRFEDVREACHGIEGVFHLAAILPPRSEANKDLTMKVNVEGTRNIIEALDGRPRIPLILASSVSTYGITASEQLPIDECRPQKVHDIYSQSKIEAERVVRESNITFTILRISAISVVDLVELPDVIPYRSDQRVEFVFVEDAAQALLSAFERPEARGRTLNIAGGRSWRVTGADYIRGFYDALGAEIEPNFSMEYTGLDWYDTSRGRFLGYQRTTLNELYERLKALGERLGLR